MDIFIVEDNAATRRFLIQLIPTLDKSYRIIGTSTNVEEANLFLKAQKPHVLLLDIELPDGKGFDIIQRWNQDNNKKFDGYVIFATAHNHYALRAIKYSAFDYLLKPIQEEELKQTLIRAKKQLENHILFNNYIDNQLETLKQNIESVENEKALLEAKPQKVILSDADRIYLVIIDEIIRCEASGNYTIVWLTEERKITVSKPIGVFEDMLPKALFNRIHRSHLINLQFFSFLDKKEGGTVHLKDGSILPIARRRKDNLLGLIEGTK
ncbi:LytR/AlgR family response regulator transcription factor [Bernardetia sp.]|uniref:LytR/AlgR family response regulator transcription factor n=1 Tax=Bernardetia sp. TaxID=1937974 RepID=UPI0025BC042F|nr:LytTR family DNA-binding domain-containing protein [Bernardetia sp.]